ncbi:MAG: proton-conducting transporter membrane subunit [Alphaproteobacteria bacterium]|nr:proton-conducting transporter membrane subunit [Alphaproteobacteria bacterium]
MTADFLILCALLLPFTGGVFLSFLSHAPNARESVTIVTGFLLLAVILTILFLFQTGSVLELKLFSIGQGGLDIGFKVEPLGLLFSLLASSLWIINSIYSIGYMRGNKEPRQTSFYFYFSIAIGGVMIVAFAANLFTFFIGYELLTLSTYPLVTHKRNSEAQRAGRLYLLLLLSTSTLFFLPAIFWTSSVASTLDFTPGGILEGKLDSLSVFFLFLLFLFGLGKAALMPVHFWLPAAMVAPTPVSALLHAVAVVKVGVFGILKIVIYIFGIDLLGNIAEARWLIYLPAFSLLLASLIAMMKDNLKARLAYSTISQLAYIVLAATLATKLSLVGGGMHILMHALGKITLFFCAGAIYLSSRKTLISEMDGLGRLMPFTFAGFLVGSLSLIGFPLFGGMWSKWHLVLGALEADQLLIVVFLMLSTLLNVMYLLPIPFRAFFCPLPDNALRSSRIQEAPLACLIAIGLTSFSCLFFFFFPGCVLDLMNMIEMR